MRPPRTTRGLAMMIVASAAMLMAASTAAAEDVDAQAAAARIIEVGERSGGICCVIDPADAGLPVAIARQGRFVVHCLTRTASARDDLRKAIRSAGDYGRVSVDVLDGERLPYAGNLITIVVVASPAKQASQGPDVGEILRVLAPLGTAVWGGPSDRGVERGLPERLTRDVQDAGTVVHKDGLLAVRKPWPDAIDEWTHYLHAADGNPVARDRVVGPPMHYQWTTGPMFQRSHETDSSLSTLVTARGRLFSIEDHAPISLAGQHDLPDKWFLIARDAFNGVVLWKVPIKAWGWRQWKNTWFNLRPGDIPLNIQKRLVAVGDKVYATLGFRAAVSQLDARTGEVLQTYPGTERTNEILLINGKLFLAVLVEDRVKVMAVDASGGKTLWESPRTYVGTKVDYYRWRAMRGKVEPAKLDPSLNMATDGRHVAFLNGPYVVCLDAANGAEAWRTAFPSDKADEFAGGIKSEGNLWIGTMIVTDGVVVHASPNRLAGFDAKTGKVLWKQPKKYIGHLWYEWKDVFVIDGLVWTWGEKLARGEYDIGRKRKQRTLAPTTVNGYDLKTGKLVREVALGNIFAAHHHHRCYRNKATLRYILASRRGTEYVDLEQGKHTVDNWVRGTCHVGMMPANGLQYAPPHPCQCYIDEKLNGMNALAPARPDEQRLAATGKPRPADKGPAFGEATGPAATSEDWPAFRRGAMRTGSVETEVPAALNVLWRQKAGRKVSAPIVVGDRLYAALVDEHHIVCHDTSDGRCVWDYAAGGRVDSPPTYHLGMLLFGSADGSVTCLRARDGARVWRFRAAPTERLMAAFGQLESTWPVHGSVLVQDGKVLFAAGRSSQLDGGLRLFSLDAATGKLLHHRVLKGPRYTVENVKQNFRLPQGKLPDVMMGDGTTIFMRNQAYSPELEPKRGSPSLKTRSGLLEDSYFKRMAWTFDKGGDYARLIVHDNRSAYFVRMFDTLRGLDPTVYFTPGQKGYLLFAKNVKGKGNAWMERVPVRIRAMVLAGDRLFVAGPPDVMDAEDPLGAFEGRKGGLLYAVDAGEGKRLTETKLPSPPVFNGTAAARGRLYLVDEAGYVTCFGKG